MPNVNDDKAGKPEATGSAAEAKEKDLEAVLPETKEEDLSEEDRALKEGLDLAVERLGDDASLHMQALEHLRTEIRSATASMTAVPKPLKFLRPHYETLKELYPAWGAGEKKSFLADILSCLAMTMAEEGSRDSLKYKLEGNKTDLGSWGHEYVRSLAGEIGQEYADRTQAEPPQPVEDLMAMVDVIAPFHVTHNAEAEAVDLLMEVQELGKLLDVAAIDETNYERICLYLLRSTNFLDNPDDLDEMLETCFELYRKQDAYTDAVRVAIKMGDKAKITNLFASCGDDLTKKQMACILGSNRVALELEDEDDLNSIIGNLKLSSYYLSLARDLDVLEPKHPDDVYKSRLSDTGGFRRSRNADVNHQSAKQNLASSFVNGFVNAGYCSDKLILGEDNTWIYMNKDQGMLSAAASLGLLQLWNMEEGLNVIDKFLYASEDKVKAGATLAIGIMCNSVNDGTDAAAGLLGEALEPGTNTDIKNAAAMGMGLAYAGSGSGTAGDLLLPLVADTETGNFDEVASAALALGQIYVGTCDEECCGTIVQRLMESTETELNQPTAVFLCVGLGLLFLGQQEKVEGMLEAVQTVEHKISKLAAVILETFAYCGTGNVLQVQKLMHLCAESLTENAEHQSAAVLGISLITAGEDVGREMALRVFDHFLHYSELPVRRAVPVALAMLYVSDPENAVIDSLSRLSHDTDAATSQAAILGLGIVGGGTNNARIAQLLRQLSEFYAREADHLFVTRVAQGLLHMGKGLMSMHPFHSDKVLMSSAAMSGILPVMFSFLNLEQTILKKHHQLLYHLVPAISPRMMMTVDEDMNVLPTSVRVGTAVETVGQAGRPKTITGFQTHNSPVLLNVNDRAELASNEFLSLTNVLEGIVILKPNPDFEDEKDEKKK
eukprot:CAMPEP_0118884814 /NCGR_PEP_ID=MMETSP1163-20130328/23532_1 /TAXON_ID=124430 /ORGANISM="Phaeomonas parva, Strain CCMP2877" /LENGTH=892 /DNA_ID=CAMNT_0006822699 /DNA_START=353 /DNA_END=3031 /DNA_ORIENTATION=-